MSLDPHHLLIGLAFGLVALAGLCLYLQRRLVTGEAEQALLEERLRQAISAQQGLTTQLDGYRVELAELSGIKSEQQAELAALRRETELLRTQRGHDTETIADLQAERDAQQAELRRLSAAHAALDAELREQHNAHQQRLSDLQAARDELRAQFAELAGRIFDEREQRFSESSHERLGQLLEPLKERIQAFEKRVEESYQHEARERFPWPESWSGCSS